MNEITSVNCTVVAEDANGEQHLFSASAPTIDMCIEKLGQIERKIKCANPEEIFADDLSSYEDSGVIINELTEQI